MDSINSKYMIGSPLNASFQGFLAYIGLKNNYDPHFKFVYGEKCLLNQYLNNSCISVPANCSLTPLAIRSSCNLCFSSVCSKCHGYLLEDCEEFSSSKNLGKNCDIGTWFDCQKCNKNIGQQHVGTQAKSFWLLCHQKR